MICKQCGTIYETAKFCVKCGIPLVDISSPESSSEAATTMEPPASVAPNPLPVMEYNNVNSTPNQNQEVPALPSMAKGWDQVKQSQVMQQGAQISKQFGTYYLKALLYPFLTAKNVTQSHFTNGMVTMFLTALLIPLTIYISLSQNSFFDLPFGKTVIKPFLFIWIALLIASLAAFGAIRLARVASDFMSVTAKIGTMLVPATASLLLCMLSVVLELGTKLPMFFFLVSIVMIFTAITSVILSIRKENTSGLDPLYGAIIVNLIVGYILVKFADLNLSNLL